MENPTAIIYDEHARPLLVKRVVTVHVFAGPDQGRRVPLNEGRVGVGTAHDNDLVVTDEHVSRHHLELVTHDQGYMVRDLGSTNGVFFRGARIQQAVLGAGSEIRIGATALRLEVGEERTQAVQGRESFGGLVGSSAAMQEVYGLLTAVAPTDVTVLIEGETGTGKEVVAETVHNESPRRRGSFCVLDCGSIAENLIESELFGHERGAFTGAVGDREGIFERARGGTVFLDEIGELPLALQTRLLRVLDRREVKRVGGNFTRKVDVRLIAATNRDLTAEVAAGRFRQDLYYRLAVIRIALPALRERREDLPLLARHFLWQAGCPDPEAVLTPQMTDKLASRQWRGNVRELRNVIERAVVLGDGSGRVDIGPETDAARFAPPDPAQPAMASAPAHPAAALRPPSAPPVAVASGDWLGQSLPLGYLARPFKEVKEELIPRLEALYLDHLLGEHGDNLSRIARAAGVDRQIIRRMLKRHGKELKR